MMKNLIIKLIVIFLGIFFLIQDVQATDTIDNSFSKYISELNTFAKDSEIDVDIDKIAENLKNGKGLSYDSIFEVILTIFFKQIRILFSSAIIVMILIIVSSLIKSLGIDKQSEVIKITNIVCFVSLSIVLISTFTSMLDLLNSTCSNISTIMQIVSPFLLGLLIVNGAITSIGIIQPLILFLTSFIGFILSNAIIPLIVLSVVFSIIGNINENSGLTRLAGYFRKIALWILGILLTIFIGILAMETSITKDVDSLAIKTTTSAVSNFVPVVGKFFSDSFETVIGASKIITKVGGVVGIIVIIIVSIVPIIKLIGACLIYGGISILSEIIDADSKIVKIIQEFSDVYKTMCGILIANSAMFIISTAIIINLGSSIVR